MNRAGQARIAASGLACSLASLAVCCPLLIGGDATRSPTAGGRQALQRADAALAAGDVRGAGQAWEEAYQAAMRTRKPDDMLSDPKVGMADAQRSLPVAPCPEH
jgi:hypothetical protein